MKRAPGLFALCAVLALAGCGSRPMRASAGSMLVGSLAGARPGSVAARAMDDSDRRRAASALDTLPDRESSAWRNHETDDSFVFTPVRSFERGGARCRDFRLEVVVGGRPDGIGGNACRQADGTWRISGGPHGAALHSQELPAS